MIANESRESRMVVVERDADGKPTVWCDPEIVDLVTALNAAGIRTVASCSGHGEKNGNIALADGRELIIVPNYKEGRRVEKLAVTPGMSNAELASTIGLTSKELYKCGSLGETYGLFHTHLSKLLEAQLERAKAGTL